MSGITNTQDGNYCAAHVAYALSEVAAIYPITLRAVFSAGKLTF